MILISDWQGFQIVKLPFLFKYLKRRKQILKMRSSENGLIGLISGLSRIRIDNLDYRG